LYFSDAKAVLSASASRSRRVASDCAIAILASFSPFYRWHLLLMFYTVSLCASALPILSSLNGSNRYFSIFISNRNFHHGLYAFRQFERLFHDQPLLYQFLQFFLLSNDFSLVNALAAASFLKLHIT
jgi:hypothetical protein